MQTLHENGWFKFDAPRPYVTVSGFAVDDCGRFPILFRGPNVRSAKNCWALPSGLHEVGKTLEEQFIAELAEELNLEGVPGSGQPLFTYENIVPGEAGAGGGWHWVIVVMKVRVVSLDTLRNSEPDKHTKVEIVDKGLKTVEAGFFDRAWAPNLAEAMNCNLSRLLEL